MVVKSLSWAEPVFVPENKPNFIFKLKETYSYEFYRL